MSTKARPVWPRRLLTLAILAVIVGGSLWSIRQLALYWVIERINYMTNLHADYEAVEMLAGRLSYEVYLERLPTEMYDAADGSGRGYDHAGALYDRQVDALLYNRAMNFEVSTSAPDTYSLTIEMLRDRDCAPVLNVLLYEETDFSMIGQVARPALSDLFQPLDLDYNFISGPRLAELQALSLDGQVIDISTGNDAAPFDACAALLDGRGQARRSGHNQEPIEVVARFSALDELPGSVRDLWAHLVERKQRSGPAPVQ
ncbi:MAG TPA: hypothetical protein DFI00_07430 [Rhodospirillaceae bacterium]|nr:hypothetical protein [Alphaproteobacteria bacterium]OUT40853.1 MAG: hypothetical protein CBB62_00325 [Micavibrio sp. TMED2]HCI47109.1 hypothetical protein [Rhodospirillaceae bacterium]MAS47667.1 hypothetical protein [Alphaproteobacteria bacterium]MAX96461.1 hypothetical protein [Alphaproteobacteria bacterium]|tara:strand:+ start:25368 stop:26141 length:774 start_codon:yes stop_codon:yes gene_type:complete